MRRLAVLLVGVFVISAALVDAQSKKGRGTATGDADMRALSEQFSKAVVAGDWTAVAGLYADDGVEMRPDMPALKGRATIQQFYEKIPVMFPGETLNKLSVNHTETRTFGDTGYDVGTYTEAITRNGTPLTTTGKYVAIAKRVDGAWKLAYLSLSSDSPRSPATK